MDNGILRGQSFLDAMVENGIAGSAQQAIAHAKASAEAEYQAGAVPSTSSYSATTSALPDAERIESLARLSPIEYDRTRETEAKALGVRAATLDKMVKDLRQEKSSTDGMTFDDIEPWPNPVDPALLLSDLVATVKRFIICPEETAHASALWIAMTWFMDVVQIAPLAVITAPEKRCGKSQLLFLLGRLVHRPLAASNITPAALFRAVDAWKPTLLVLKPINNETYIMLSHIRPETRSWPCDKLNCISLMRIAN